MLLVHNASVCFIIVHITNSGQGKQKVVSPVLSYSR